MKKILTRLAAMASLFLLIGCAGNTGESEEQMIAAATELDKKFTEAYNSGDVDGVMATYWNSPDLVSYPPDMMESKGWENTKMGLEQFFSQVKGAKLELNNFTHKVAGDMVVTWGTWTITMPDSAATKMAGRYTDVKAKHDGKWVYIHDHASVPLAPPPAQQP